MPPAEEEVSAEETGNTDTEVDASDNDIEESWVRVLEDDVVDMLGGFPDEASAIRDHRAQVAKVAGTSVDSDATLLAKCKAAYQEMFPDDDCGPCNHTYYFEAITRPNA